MPGDDKIDAIRHTGDRLIEQPEMVAIGARQRIFGHNAEADFAGDQNHVIGGLAQPLGQRGAGGGDIGFAPQQMRQPKREAIDKARAGAATGRESLCKVQTHLPLLPDLPPPRTVEGHPGRHLGVFHLRSRQIEGPPPAREGEIFGMQALARARAACDQSDGQDFAFRFNRMSEPAMLEISLIRHAPVAHGGRLIGRTDLPSQLPDTPSPMRDDPGQIWCSPALRCRQTAAWLWPERQDVQLSDDLWEQDFGDWEGACYADLPDLGQLDRAALAMHRAPGGESFLELAARVERFLMGLSGPGPIAIVAHAGVIRSALGLALEVTAAGLSFSIDTLSQTKLVRHSGAWAVQAVNHPLLKVQP